MGKRIQIDLEGVQASARLHDELAPETAASVWAALPIEGRLRHVRWSGEAGYILVSEMADPSRPIENPISFYPPGAIAFRPEHGEVAFSYGQAQARDHLQRSGLACHLATVETNLDSFLEKVRATCTEGGKTIRLQREDQA